AVGRDSVVQVRVRIRPVPLREDDVALDARRALRRGWHLARRDTIGPVGEHRERALLPHRVEAACHLLSRLAGLDAAIPCVDAAVERAQLFGDFARALRPELMARRAAA